jgi:hypothetical protein
MNVSISSVVAVAVSSETSLTAHRRLPPLARASAACLRRCGRFSAPMRRCSARRKAARCTSRSASHVTHRCRFACSWLGTRELLGPVPVGYEGEPTQAEDALHEPLMAHGSRPNCEPSWLDSTQAQENSINSVSSPRNGLQLSRTYGMGFEPSGWSKQSAFGGQLISKCS